MLFAAKTVGPGIWADTSEALNLSQYQYLALAGFRGCFRYVPRADQSPAVGIQLAELQAALSVKCPDGSPFSIQFVQFARSNGISAQSGQEDGAAAAEYVKALGSLPTVCVWQDLDYAPAATAIAYSNASYAAMQSFLAAQAPGCYCEPGYSLTAAQRYSELDLHRYWATAANDPNRFPQPRGVQVIQLWESSKGEYSPIPGLEIDGDAIQGDYYTTFPVGLVAA